MSKMIQVRNVPDDLHRKLKARAAKEGLSLSDYILGELRRIPDRVTMQDLLQRVGTIVRGDVNASPAALIRAERDRRSEGRRG
ncbi:MAG: toxin-antitoxin system HicB family antitoxin [Kofleriaceae bacterium]|nr:toxin-antitoxin system HicB family antitoxin [Kofleriaceae bacterium]